MNFLVGLGAECDSHTIHRAKDKQNLHYTSTKTINDAFLWEEWTNRLIRPRCCLWGIKPFEAGKDRLAKGNFRLDSIEEDIDAFMVQVVDAEMELGDWPSRL
jgi:hypothetical protein